MARDWAEAVKIIIEVILAFLKPPYFSWFCTSHFSEWGIQIHSSLNRGLTGLATSFLIHLQPECNTLKLYVLLYISKLYKIMPCFEFSAHAHDPVFHQCDQRSAARSTVL